MGMMCVHALPGVFNSITDSDGLAVFISFVEKLIEAIVVVVCEVTHGVYLFCQQVIGTCLEIVFG